MPELWAHILLACQQDTGLQRPVLDSLVPPGGFHMQLQQLQQGLHPAQGADHVDHLLACEADPRCSPAVPSLAALLAPH